MHTIHQVLFHQIRQPIAQPKLSTSTQCSETTKKSNPQTTPSQHSTIHPDHLGILYTQNKPTVIAQLTSSITILGKSLQGGTFLRLHEGKQCLCCSRNCIPNPCIDMHTYDMKTDSITSPKIQQAEQMLRYHSRDQPQQRPNSLCYSLHFTQESRQTQLSPSGPPHHRMHVL